MPWTRAATTRCRTRTTPWSASTSNSTAWTFDRSGWIYLDTWDSDLRLTSSRGVLRLATRGEAWTRVGTWDGQEVSLRE